MKKSYFLESLEKRGILRDDPRIKPVFDALINHGEYIQKNTLSLCMSQGGIFLLFFLYFYKDFEKIKIDEPKKLKFAHSHSFGGLVYLLAKNV